MTVVGQPRSSPAQKKKVTVSPRRPVPGPSAAQPTVSLLCAAFLPFTTALGMISSSPTPTFIGPCGYDRDSRHNRTLHKLRYAAERANRRENCVRYPAERIKSRLPVAKPCGLRAKIRRFRTSELSPAALEFPSEGWLDRPYGECRLDYVPRQSVAPSGGLGSAVVR